MLRIMTVCTGNICRSPMGEYLIKKAAQESGLSLRVTSSGISREEEGNPIDPRAARVLSERGIETADHRAKQFSQQDYHSNDLILAMDLNHYRVLKKGAKSPEDAAKVHLMREFDPAVANQEINTLGIYDPWYGNQDDFYATFTMIDDAVKGLITHLVSGDPPHASQNL